MKNFNLLIIVLFLSKIQLFAIDTFPGHLLDLDGGEHVEVPYSADLNPAQFTVSFWAKVEGGAGTARSLITSRSTTKGFMIYANSTDTWDFWIRKGDTVSNKITGPAVVLNEWVHIAGTYDGTDMYLYVNGEISGHLNSVSFVPNSQYPLRIGAGYTEGTADYFFNGKIDEMSLWNYARTAREIREDMHNTLDGSETGLVSCWQFNEGTGTILSDCVGTHNGSLTNCEEEDWLISAVPTGGGYSYREIVGTTGPLQFTDTGVTIDFTAKTGIDSLVVSKIENAPDTDSADDFGYFRSQYWVINKFGSGSFTGDLTFTVSDHVRAEYETDPSLVKLYRRDVLSNSDWAYVGTSASADSVSSSLTFPGISSTGQYMIGTEAVTDRFADKTVDFDGGYDYFEIPYNPDLNTHEFTVSFWAKVEGGTNTFRSPITSRSSTTGYMFYASDDNRWEFWTRDGDDTSNKVDGDSVLVNQWTHIAGTYDGSTMILYVNGRYSGSISGISYVPNDLYPLRIGAGYTQSDPDYFFNGKIDEMQYWNRALTADEIRSNINLPLTGQESGLVSYWQFNDNYDYANLTDLIHYYNAAGYSITSGNWQDSFIPLGNGAVSSIITGSAGSFTLPGTGVSLDFTEKTGIDTFYVTLINSAPNTVPENLDDVLDSQYWVLRKYGDGTFTSDIEFTFADDITASDENNPHYFCLYNREEYTDYSWSFVSRAVSADNLNDRVAYENIDHSAQFFTGKVTSMTYKRLTPSDNSTNVSLRPELKIEFEKDILIGSGNITIKNNNNDTVVETIPVSSASIIDSIATFTPSNSLDFLTSYCVLIDSSAFFSVDSMFFNGIQSKYTWNFQTANQFTLISSNVNKADNSSVSWGDYDNDGDLDILLTGYYYYSFWGSIEYYYSRIYRNDNGYFSIRSNLTGVHYGSAVWGDYDNDGDIDILLTGITSSGSKISKIYRNDSGLFTDTNVGLTGVSSSSAAWGDYDNDGDLDILLTGSSSTGNISKIYRNDSGAFTDINAGLTGVSKSSVSWDDYDNDGDLDILLTGITGSGSIITKVYRNSSGSFTDINAGLPGVYYGSVSWGDYDNDGDLDILLTGTSSTGYVSKIYRNDSGAFTDINAGLTGVSNSSVSWGDYDNDGDLDILLTGITGSGSIITKVYRNSSGSFVSSGIFLTGVYKGDAAWGDYDNDGDLDILLTGYNNGYIGALYRNNTASINTEPVSPINLFSEVTGHEATLSWDKAFDSETLQDGLSYNLYLSITSMTDSIMSSMSNNSTGYRKVVAVGNAAQNTSWTINGLEGGTYYWSVQAIDHAYAGSEFSAERSFMVLDNPINVITNISGSDLILSWDAVDGAASYKVYSSDDPYGTFTEDNGGVLAGETWTIAYTESKKFYYVVAVDSKTIPSAKKKINVKILNSSK